MCSSPISLLATATAVAYMSHFVLVAIKLYLGTAVEEQPAPAQVDQNRPFIGRQAHSGWEEGSLINVASSNKFASNEPFDGCVGATVLLLSILTGISDMKQQSRMAVLTIILFVVLSSLLQSMLDIAEPVILSLSASLGRNVFHHVKVIAFIESCVVSLHYVCSQVLLLCTFLFMFPLHVTWVLAQIFPVDFWMAVVLSTSVLTSAQVLDLIVVHCLLWYDTTRDEPWAPLDEVCAPQLWRNNRYRASHCLGRVLRAQLHQDCRVLCRDQRCGCRPLRRRHWPVVVDERLHSRRALYEMFVCSFDVTTHCCF